MKISIIIPTYNSEEYIIRCLDSIKKQKVKPFEIIIVNDGSTDNTLNLVDAYELENKKVITIENHGQGYARNLALKQAIGDYVLFLDSDDILLENAIEVLDNIIQKQKLDVINFDYQITYLNGNTNIHKRFADIKGKLEGDCSILLKNKYYFTVNNLYNREFLLANDIRYGEDYIYEDYEFWLEVALNAKSALLLDEVLYEVIKEETSTTNSNHQSNKHAKDFLKAVKVCLDYIKDEKRENVKYLYRYILNRFFVYYEKRTPKEFKTEFLKKFVDLLSNYNISSFAHKKFNILLKLNVFNKRKYFIFTIYTYTYCSKKFKKGK